MTINTIDLRFQGEPELIAAYLIRSGGECALIETGPFSCHSNLVNGLVGYGVQPRDIGKVFVTHIHLDHSGAAGWWAQHGAQVYVHPKGASHLIDPTKLIDSAAMIYGSEMQRLWGDILPAPAERVTELSDGDCIKVGEIEIQAWDTPGHARHHHSYVIGDICFPGDVAGMKLPGCDYISVTSAPPQFDLKPYLASIERLSAANFRLLYLTHYGALDNPNPHLNEYGRRVQENASLVEQWLSQGNESDLVMKKYAEREKGIAGLAEENWLRYQRGNSTAMCAAGIELFCKKGQN